MPQSSFLLEAIQTMTEKLGCRRTCVSSMKAQLGKTATNVFNIACYYWARLGIRFYCIFRVCINITNPY